MSVSYSYHACNLLADAIAGALNNGYLRIYSGVRRAVPDDAITNQILLSEHRFSDPAFLAAAVNGVIEADTIASGIAVNTGIPTWFAALASDSTTAIIDGSIGPTGSGADLELGNLYSGQILENRTVEITSLVYTQPR